MTSPKKELPMQACVPLRVFTFLLIALLNLSVCASNQPERFLKLPQAQGKAVKLSLRTALKNLDHPSLGYCLAQKSIGEVLVIQAMKSDAGIDYYYSTPFAETDPAFIAKYKLKITLQNGQRVPVVIGSSFKKIGLNLAAACFPPAFNNQNPFDHPVNSIPHYPYYGPFPPAPMMVHTPQYPYYGPFPPALMMVYPPQEHFSPQVPSEIPPIITRMLSSRTAALINIMHTVPEIHRRNQVLRTTSDWWGKTLQPLCEKHGYPFELLDLSFPSTEDASKTPQHIPYTTEGAIKEKEEKIALDSTSEEERELLRKDIEILRQCIEDSKKVHPLAYDGTYYPAPETQRILGVTNDDLLASPAQPVTEPVATENNDHVPTPPAAQAATQPMQEEVPVSIDPTEQKTENPPLPQEENVPLTTTTSKDIPTLQKTTPAPTKTKQSPAHKTGTKAAHKTGTQTTPKAKATSPAARSIPVAPTAKAATKTATVTTPPTPVKEVATPAAAKTLPAPSSKSEQPQPRTPATPPKDDFFAQCLAAATESTLPAPKAKRDEKDDSSKFEKKQQAAEEYRLKQLAKKQAKEAANAEKTKLEQEKTTIEDQLYFLIENACAAEEYDFVMHTLARCDTKTKRFVDMLFFFTTHLVQKNHIHRVPGVAPIIAEFLRQNDTLPKDQNLHFLSCVRLGNIVAEAQSLALQIKEQFDAPHFKPCSLGEHCLHTRVTTFFGRHGENDVLKPLLATYLLSAFSKKSQCPNVVLEITLEQLYSTAQHYLSPEDYASLLTIAPFERTENQLSDKDPACFLVAGGIPDLDAIIRFALHQSDCLPSASSQQPPTFSHSPFTTSLLDIFGTFNKIREEFEEKIKRAPEKSKKAVTTLFNRRKSEITTTTLALLKTIKTREEVDNFLTALIQFEVNESYPDIRKIIDDYLPTCDKTLQHAWRPYVICPNPRNFTSLTPCATPGAFPIRCAAFHKQLDEYFSKAPSEKEVYKAIEALALRFLTTTHNCEEIILLFKTAGPTLTPFYIAAFFNYLKNPDDFKKIPNFDFLSGFENDLKMYGENLQKQIEAANTNASMVASLTTFADYLKETLVEIQLFIHEKGIKRVEVPSASAKSVLPESKSTLEESKTPRATPLFRIDSV